MRKGDCDCKHDHRGYWKLFVNAANPVTFSTMQRKRGEKPLMIVPCYRYTRLSLKGFFELNRLCILNSELSAIF